MVTAMAGDGFALSGPSLFRLMAWLSPSYPVGAYSFSHGLEWAVESGSVRDEAGLAAFVATVVRRGGGFVDAVFLARAWRAAQTGEVAALDRVNAEALAFRATAETAAESVEQGAAFARVTVAAWPDTPLSAWLAGSSPRAVAYPVAVGAAGAAVPREAVLWAYLHGVAANLVSAGVRLIPLGQTAGQRVLAGLVPVVEGVIAAAPERLGTAAPLVEIASMRHETQYTRLFRS